MYSNHQNGDLNMSNDISIVHKKGATTPSVESLGSAKVMWLYAHIFINMCTVI